MFKKLNFSFNKPYMKSILYLQKNIKHRSNDDHIDLNSCNEKEKELILYYINQKGLYRHSEFDYLPVLKCLPQSILKKEIPTVNWQIFEKGLITPPHIDRFRKSALNLYINTNDEVTNFYTKKSDGVIIKSKIHGWQNNELFLPNSVELVSSFIAKPLDLYLLNVSMPHSVTNMKLNSRRISLSFTFTKLSFEELTLLID